MNYMPTLVVESVIFISKYIRKTSRLESDSKAIKFGEESKNPLWFLKLPCLCFVTDHQQEREKKGFLSQFIYGMWFQVLMHKKIIYKAESPAVVWLWLNFFFTDQWLMLQSYVSIDWWCNIINIKHSNHQYSKCYYNFGGIILIFLIG